MVAGLAARAMRALRDAFRPSGVVSGFVADLTRSRAELITENTLLRQQLIVAARAVKRPVVSQKSIAHAPPPIGRDVSRARAIVRGL